MNISSEEWYNKWFDSPYYHKLYRHRDEKEARFFIVNLCRHLNLKTGAKILDMGCGKGRHALLLNAFGYDVTGIDLSSRNIRHASRFAQRGLAFHLHDMSTPFHISHFDCAIIIFTSFGYFSNEEDDLRTLHSAAECLKPGGIFVLDFMNVKKVIPALVKNETVTSGSTRFYIERKISDNFIVKDIKVTANDKTYNFRECVRMLCLADFKKYFRKSGFCIKEIFGNYGLDGFDENVSDRLVLVCYKK